MDSELPNEMIVERDAPIEEVYAAFEGVDREGGVSWSESTVLGDYGTDEERTEARAQDTEARWEELVEERDWEGDRGTGGWSFLDPIGFRYYLPVQIVRSLWEGRDYGNLGVAFNLIVRCGTIPRSGGSWEAYGTGKFSLLDPRQRRCVRRFTLYMEGLDRLWESPFGYWAETLESYWRDLPEGER